MTTTSGATASKTEKVKAQRAIKSREELLGAMKRLGYTFALENCITTDHTTKWQDRVDYVLDLFYGLVAPQGTEPKTIEELHASLGKVDKKIQSRFELNCRTVPYEVILACDGAYHGVGVPDKNGRAHNTSGARRAFRSIQAWIEYGCPLTSSEVRAILEKKYTKKSAKTIEKETIAKVEVKVEEPVKVPVKEAEEPKVLISKDIDLSSKSLEELEAISAELDRLLKIKAEKEAQVAEKLRLLLGGSQ